MVQRCSVSSCPYHRGLRGRLYLLSTVITSQGEQTRTLSARRRRGWLERLGMASWDATKTSKSIWLCPAHFVGGKPAGLHSDTSLAWLPSLKLDIDIDTTIPSNTHSTTPSNTHSTIPSNTPSSTPSSTPSTTPCTTHSIPRHHLTRAKRKKKKRWQRPTRISGSSDSEYDPCSLPPPSPDAITESAKSATPIKAVESDVRAAESNTLKSSKGEGLEMSAIEGECLKPSEDVAHLQCSECHQVLRSEALLISHMRLHTKTSVMKCTSGPSTNTRPMALENHTFTHLSPGHVLECKLCQKMCQTEGDMNKHHKEHTQVLPFSTPPFKCTPCNAPFFHPTLLKRHMKVHIKMVSNEEVQRRAQEAKKAKKVEESKKAEESKESQESKEAEGWDGVEDGGSSLLKCIICFQQFKEKKRMILHTVEHTNEQPFQCCLCQKEFTHRGKLIPHMRLHVRDNQPYTCPSCQQTFVRKSKLLTHLWQQHMRITAGLSQIFTLDDIYSYPSAVKKKHVVCPVCSGRQENKQDFFSHLFTHRDILKKVKLPKKVDGRKHIICPVCDKRFFLTKSVQDHLKKHVNIYIIETNKNSPDKMQTENYKNKTIENSRNGENKEKGSDLPKKDDSQHEFKDKLCSGSEFSSTSHLQTSLQKCHNNNNNAVKSSIVCQAEKIIEEDQRVTKADDTTSTKVGSVRPNAEMDNDQNSDKSIVENNCDAEVHNPTEGNGLNFTLSQETTTLSHIQNQKGSDPACPTGEKTQEKAIQTHTPETVGKSFFCSLCDEECPTRMSLIEHFLSHKDYVCLKDKLVKKCPIKRHLASPKYFCPYCNQGFITRALYSPHTAQNHNKLQNHDDRISCPVCDKNFLPKRMSLHLNKHEDMHKIYINIEKETAESSVLPSRVDEPRAEKSSFCCSICSEEFPLRVLLVKHFLSHELFIGLKRKLKKKWNIHETRSIKVFLPKSNRSLRRKASKYKQKKIGTCHPYLGDHSYFKICPPDMEHLIQGSSHGTGDGKVNRSREDGVMELPKRKYSMEGHVTSGMAKVPGLIHVPSSSTQADSTRNFYHHGNMVWILNEPREVLGNMLTQSAMPVNQRTFNYDIAGAEWRDSPVTSATSIGVESIKVEEEEHDIKEEMEVELEDVKVEDELDDLRENMDNVQPYEVVDIKMEDDSNNAEIKLEADSSNNDMCCDVGAF